VLNAVKSSGSNFFIALGDLSYSDVTPESAWCDFVKARVGDTYPFELLAGNHEDDGPDGLISKFDDCLPHRLENITGTYAKEFYFDYPSSNPLARFISISPNLTFPGEGTWDYSAGSARYNWTGSAIDQARAAGIKWVIVSVHKYCIAMVSGSCQIGPDIMNLLIEKRVDLYLQGHDHAFYRSKQLAHLTGCAAVSPGSFDPDCVVDSGADGQYAKNAGAVIVTTGAGGKSINSVNTSDPEAGYFASWMGSNANPTYGFLKVTISNTSLTAQFVRGAGGTYTDTFTIR
jgi:Calcineurin-like phosphoesterase